MAPLTVAVAASISSGVNRTVMLPATIPDAETARLTAAASAFEGKSAIITASLSPKAKHRLEEVLSICHR